MLRGKYGVLNAYSVKDEMSKPITVVRKKKKDQNKANASTKKKQ